jgi:hypothetical protein
MRRVLVFILLSGSLVSDLSAASSNDLSLDSTASPQKSQQSQSSPSTEERYIFNPESLSPFLIEWLIDINEEIDLKRIWRLLKVEISDDAPYKCRDDCSAETFDIEVEGNQRGRTVALKVSFGSSGFYQYLLFKKVSSDTAREHWSFIGNINSTDQLYGPPQHRIESGDNRTWFVIREQWGRAKEAAAIGEVWYEIKETEIRRVLSYPVEGRNTPCQKRVGRSYKSLPLRHGLENGAYTIWVKLLATYSISECDKISDSHPLFTKEKKAFYVWDSEKERFTLDKSRSDITESEINSLNHREELSREKFIEYNFNELLYMAGSGDRVQKDWLRKFLTDVKDGPLKVTLQQAFQK